MDLSMLIPTKGRAQRYSPDKLYEKFQEYVAHMHTKGLIWVFERVTYRNETKLEPVPKRAPLTTKGFCIFAGIPHATFKGYLTEGSSTYAMFNDVASYIDDACAVDVFNGAAVGVFSGNAVAAVARKAFEVSEADERGGRSVETIRHEIAFSDYTEIGTTEQLPPSVEDVEGVEQLAHRLPQAVDMEAEQEQERGQSHSPEPEPEKEKERMLRPQEGDYDNLPPQTSRHHNMEQYNERNNINTEEGS